MEQATEQMATVKINLSMPASVYYKYPEPYTRIALKLKEKKMHYIGNREEALRRQEEMDRPLSVDIPIRERAIRSMYVRAMTEGELDYLHRVEWFKRKNFLVLPQISYSMMKRFEKSMPSPQVSEEQMDYLIKFNRDNRPRCSYVDDVPVPPYFDLDYSFDGMAYHHAWDKCVQHAIFMMPTGGNGGKKMAEEILR